MQQSSLQLTILSLFALCISCSQASNEKLEPGRGVNEGQRWMSSAYSSSESQWLYLNFYSEYEKYPGYGVANYCCDRRRDSEYSDLELMRDSLRRIRGRFGKAYETNAILSWDSEKTEYVPFRLEYVCVILSDQTKGRYCGIVLSAKTVFAAAHEDAIELSESDIEREAVFEVVYPEGQSRMSYSPAQANRYWIIERHQEATLHDQDG